MKINMPAQGWSASGGKKILFSIAGIVAVAALVVTSTGALFSDTETSTGNVFTAGAIDLKVDHLAQSYNGVDCKTCSVEIKSDITNQVVAQNGLPVTPYNASALSFVHPAWTASVPGATWIWEANPVSQADTNNNVTYTFRKTFTWFGPISGATINLAVASDNSYIVYLNGTQVGADASENNFASADTIVNIDDNIVQGTNILEVVVKNKALAGSNPASNPAGLLYKLTINGNCGDAYFQNHCTLFSEKDLVSGTDYFWKFDDVKPGDHGTNLVSLHVYSNDANVCLFSHGMVSTEEGIVDPETTAGDVSTPAGELQKYIKLFAWADEGDGVYEGEANLVPVNTPINTEVAQLVLPTTSTGYVGLAWCAGVQSLSGNTILCNGSGNQNDAQTDKLVLSMTAYAEQQRNVSNFSCATVATSMRPQ